MYSRLKQLEKRARRVLEPGKAFIVIDDDSSPAITPETKVSYSIAGKHGELTLAEFDKRFSQSRYELNVIHIIYGDDVIQKKSFIA